MFWLNKINQNSVSYLDNVELTIFNNKGNCHLKLGNYKEAIKDFEYVIRKDRENGYLKCVADTRQRQAKFTKISKKK